MCYQLGHISIPTIIYLLGRVDRPFLSEKQRWDDCSKWSVQLNVMILITLNSLQTLEGPAWQGLWAAAMGEEPLVEVPFPANGD